MDIRFVSSLLSVIDLGSLAAAARAERITASAVSQRVAALEAELQVPLLLRVGRTMQPTPQCLRVMSQFRQLLRTQAEVRAGVLEQHLAGPFRLGAISTALSDYAPALVRALYRQAPEVELKLTPGTSRELYTTFEAELLEGALIVQPPFELPKTMTFTAISTQKVGLLSPSVMANSVDLPFVVYNREAWGGATCWQALKQRWPQPRILAEMDALETIAQMVEDGVARAVLPEWSGLRARYSNVRFESMSAPPREIGVLRWTRDKANPMQNLLHRILTLEV